MVRTHNAKTRCSHEAKQPLDLDIRPYPRYTAAGMGCFQMHGFGIAWNLLDGLASGSGVLQQRDSLAPHPSQKHERNNVDQTSLGEICQMGDCPCFLIRLQILLL